MSIEIKNKIVGYEVISNESEVTTEPVVEKEPEKVKACPDGNWSDVVIFDGLAHCFRSKHHRKLPKEPIILYHTFLVFC